MVQGASRGIGLEFVKQLLEKNDKGHVVATCRNPDRATGLVDLKDKFAERLNIVPLDLTIESTIEASAKFIREKYGSLNLLINASGILSIPNVLQPETTLSKVERSSLMLSYEVNAVGPILAIKHMWPLLKAGGGFGAERDVAVVANLSARVGSIGDNHLVNSCHRMTLIGSPLRICKFTEVNECYYGRGSMVSLVCINLFWV
ncbi:hypothetical protein OIU77_008596 [Salix suchowensis]|uniref:Uncharacterized protein n=1 Tax=Salix suchowensis TaxID=1278906 RepID=A0ABQ9ABY7_9ROSI|nr:hypothetical protein OIU77_008596 [Salix suchowensis]